MAPCPCYLGACDVRSGQSVWREPRALLHNVVCARPAFFKAGVRKGCVAAWSLRVTTFVQDITDRVTEIIRRYPALAATARTGIGLRACYAQPGTDRAYAATTRLSASDLDAALGSTLHHLATRSLCEVRPHAKGCLRRAGCWWRYAMTGTDIACGVWYIDLRCPVLTSRMESGDLRACYAIIGTDLVYGVLHRPTRLSGYAMPGTERAQAGASPMAACDSEYGGKNAIELARANTGRRQRWDQQRQHAGSILLLRYAMCGTEIGRGLDSTMCGTELGRDQDQHVVCDTEKAGGQEDVVRFLEARSRGARCSSLWAGAAVCADSAAVYGGAAAPAGSAAVYAGSAAVYGGNADAVVVAGGDLAGLHGARSSGSRTEMAIEMRGLLCLKKTKSHRRACLN
eukprot:442628-Rhodomonas_salina.1